MMAGGIQAQNDRKGSSDHPLISRMPNFWIAVYQESEHEPHTFGNSSGMETEIVGHYYHIEYRLNKGAQAPGRLMILKNYENIMNQIDAEILKKTQKDLYTKVTRDGHEIWIQIHALERVYRLTIVEREQKEHEVVAKTEAAPAENATAAPDIHEAAKSGTLDEVKALVAKGESVNAKDDRDLTPLYYAAYAGHKEICLFLIDQGADLNAAPEPFYSPLYAAFNKRNKNGEEIFMLLVERGADFNIMVGGYTFLHNAALSCHDESQRNLAGFLISKGADINVKGYQDKTPLHMVGCHEICELLISKGADVNARDNRGWTPLRQALENGDPEVGDFLKKHGAVE